MTAKKVMFWLWLVLTVFCIIGGITVLQLLPLLAIIALIWIDTYGRKKLIVPIIVISSVMAILNLVVAEPSFVDVLMWLVTICVYAFIKEPVKQLKIKK
jgi:hypothetical protein